jgi:hypothetical protein
MKLTQRDILRAYAPPRWHPFKRRRWFKLDLSAGSAYSMSKAEADAFIEQRLRPYQEQVRREMEQWLGDAEL